jgi:exodeoxyribonuclease VII large subunit
VGHEVDYTIADFAADLRAPTPSAAAEMVLRRKTELFSEVGHLANSLVRTLGRRLDASRRQAAMLARALREPSLLLGYLGQRLDDLHARLSVSARSLIARRRGTLAGQTDRLRLRHPGLVLERRRERLGLLSLRLTSSLQQQLERRRDALSLSSATLNSLSPLATLARGYSIARRPDGTLVTDSGLLAPRDRLCIRFRRGAAECLVEQVVSPADDDGLISP